VTPASRLREAASSPPNRAGLSPLGLTERDCLRWPLNAHAGLSAKQLPAYRAARVLDDLRQGSRRSRSLVYGVLHGLVLPVWRGMGSRPRRALSRLGGATVVTGGAGPACGHARAVCVGVAYFKVADAAKSVVAIENAGCAINQIAPTTHESRRRPPGRGQAGECGAGHQR